MENLQMGLKFLVDQQPFTQLDLQPGTEASNYKAAKVRAEEQGADHAAQWEYNQDNTQSAATNSEIKTSLERENC